VAKIRNLAPMFTGIIETTGTIKEITSKGTNSSFWIESPISPELKPDQSLSHNGVCLTVEEIQGNAHRVTAIEETLKKTNLSAWKTGNLVNLERCLQINGRLDGHFVQGHVDTTGVIEEMTTLDGSWEFIIRYPEEFAALTIEKGSITVNGISLTLFNVGIGVFTVAIIPFTHDHTNLQTAKKGDLVNLEFDILGKYIISGMKRSYHL
jgi:riboflavin synthase